MGFGSIPTVIPYDTGGWIEFAVIWFLVVIPGFATAYSFLRPNFLRVPLIVAAFLLFLLWLLGARFSCSVFLRLCGELSLCRGCLHLPQRGRNFIQIWHHWNVIVLEPRDSSGFIHDSDRPARNAFVRQVHAKSLARRSPRMKIRQ